jgi:hypothetical protein
MITNELEEYLMSLEKIKGQINICHSEIMENWKAEEIKYLNLALDVVCLEIESIKRELSLIVSSSIA